jgi:hypothetical protein
MLNTEEQVNAVRFTFLMFEPIATLAEERSTPFAYIEAELSFDNWLHDVRATTLRHHQLILVKKSILKMPTCPYICPVQPV